MSLIYVKLYINRRDDHGAISSNSSEHIDAITDDPEEAAASSFRGGLESCCFSLREYFPRGLRRPPQADNQPAARMSPHPARKPSCSLQEVDKFPQQKADGFFAAQARDSIPTDLWQGKSGVKAR